MTLRSDQQCIANLGNIAPRCGVWLIFASLLAVTMQPADAAQLGEVVSVSPIGQALRVEISSPGSRNDEIVSCIRAPAPRPSADGIPAVRDARISMTGHDQNARIVVTHPAATGEPILRLTLESTCTSRLQREYILFLPEPLERASPPSRRTVSPRTAQPVAPALPRGTQTWVTFPGESVESLAQAMYPRDPGARRAFTTGILRANPQVFGARADAFTPLPPGTELNMPSVTSVSAASSEERRPVPPRGTAPSVARSAVPPAPDAPAQATQQTSATVADRLLLETTRARDSERVALDALASEAAREEVVVAAIDRTIETQLDIMQRLNQLEEIQLALRAELEAEERLTGMDPPPQPRLETPAGATQSATTEAIPERPQAPTTRESTNNWLGWAGLLGAVALMLALLLRRKGAGAAPARLKRSALSRSEADKVAPASSPAAGQEALAQRTAAEDHNKATPTTPRVALDWEGPDDPTERGITDEQTVPPLTLDDDTAEEHESAIELAEIMVSFGRLHGAAETLADFIRSNPRQSLTPWLKLMDVYHVADMRVEFDALARQLNKTFNVKTVTWENFEASRKHGGSIEAMPHIIDRLTRTWRTPECQAYIERILRDNRDGARQGFGLGVIDDFLVLSNVLEEQLGRFKPTTQP